jgi:hypothetical protein
MSNQPSIPAITVIPSLDFPATLKRLQAKRTAILAGARPLNSKEVGQLETQGNSAQDWNAVRVGGRFNPGSIRNNRFFGACFLGSFDGAAVATGASISLPTGIYDSVIVDSVIADGCCVWNVKGCGNYFIDDHAVLCNVGTLVCGADALFGNGREIVIGIETGGREVLSYADMTIAVAQAVARQRDALNDYRAFIEAYCGAVRSGFGIVAEGCCIVNCPQIVDSFLGAAARCTNATLVRNAAILSSREEPTTVEDGVYVRNSCLQWGCHASSMAIVDDSVLTEHSHAERHGKVTHSIIGPNTGIAEGEVTASLVGPFVGFHHQSLLIGALWPEGKGNVAYGANVGSNHTSKAPDQEIYCGEGLFFGLGANIKFPADFSGAPYSIIATGVTTLPQRVSFPFSLINNPSRRVDGVPPAYNELSPGWVLSDNLYTVARNEGKYLKRNKAKRSTFDFEVFRPEIVDLMVAARDKLRSAAADREYYTDADIAGIGKNFVLRQSLVKGIEAYTLHIERYCLAGLLRRIRQCAADRLRIDEKVLSAAVPGDARWEHERAHFMAEGFGARTLVRNLERYAELSAMAAQAIAAAKEKDDARGKTVMEDYGRAHTPAAADGFVRETAAKNETLQKEIRELIARHAGS